MRCLDRLTYISTRSILRQQGGGGVVSMHHRFGPSLLMPPHHCGLPMLGRGHPSRPVPFVPPHYRPELPVIHPAMMPYRYHTHTPIIHQQVNIVVLDSPHRMESRQISMNMPPQATLLPLGTPQRRTGASPLSKASPLLKPFTSLDRRADRVESQRPRDLNPPRRAQNMPKTLPTQTGKVSAVVKPPTRQASVKMATSGSSAFGAPSRSQTLSVRLTSRAASAPAALPRIKELAKTTTSRSGSSSPAMLPVFPSATAVPSAAVGSQTSLLSATAPSASREQVAHKRKVAYVWSVPSKPSASAKVDISTSRLERQSGSRCASCSNLSPRGMSAQLAILPEQAAFSRIACPCSRI